MVFPPIHWFQGLGAEVLRDVGDIEFLSKKEFDGKLVKADGSATTVSTIITLTASSGKDLYLARARVTAIDTDTGTSLDHVTVILKQDTTVIGTWQAGFGTNSGSSTNIGTGIIVAKYDFAITGVKVAATKTFTIEISATTGNPTVYAELLGFEETTGETPVI